MNIIGGASIFLFFVVFISIAGMLKWLTEQLTK